MKDTKAMLVGGVKGTELTVEELETIRTTNPLLDVFGMNDPVMFGGTLFMGFTPKKETEE